MGIEYFYECLNYEKSLSCCDNRLRWGNGDYHKGHRKLTRPVTRRDLSERRVKSIAVSSNGRQLHLEGTSILSKHNLNKEKMVWIKLPLWSIQKLFHTEWWALKSPIKIKREDIKLEISDNTLGDWMQGGM